MLAHCYLDGLNGVEIGASIQNSFGLNRSGGYANIDFSYDQGAKWQSEEFPATAVNIVANGDDLPFKDNSLDYVLNSHVIEHFFDPIKALHEWHRVVKPNGIIFIICPHIERTFDATRELTCLNELLSRNAGTLSFHDYAQNLSYGEVLEKVKGCSRSELISLTKGAEPHVLVCDRDPPENHRRYTRDDHHHWTTWTTESFLEMCDNLGFKVVDFQDVDDKVGNGFTVVLRVEKN